MIDFEFKTEPFPAQLKNFLEHSGDDVHGLLWQQGTGKSKIAIDHAARIYSEGKIDAVLVLAPGGVHDNWHTRELPAHCPVKYLSFAWASSKAKTLRHQEAAERVAIYPKLAWVLMAYSGFMTERGRAFVDKILERRRVMVILDESHMIKTIDAKRTKAVTGMGAGVKYKRILTGTPTAGSPFDLYTQLWFLDSNFWRRHGFAKYYPFKNYFGKWRTRTLYEPGQWDLPESQRKVKRRFPELVAFRNVDKLNAMIMELCTRVTKDDALNLPDQFYHNWKFELEPEQRRIYNELRDEFLVFLDSGEMVTAPMMITRLLRLQQISCGYLPHDDCEHFTLLKHNPRLELLLESLPHIDNQVIIFARFRQDIEQICSRLGDECLRYDGAITQDERNRNEKIFREPGAPKYFVGNPAVCSMGLTLVSASSVVYYSNSFKWIDRVQSEDRVHRIGQTEDVTYIDLFGINTVDSRIVDSLRNRNDVAASITGDQMKEWL